MRWNAFGGQGTSCPSQFSPRGVWWGVGLRPRRLVGQALLAASFPARLTGFLPASFKLLLCGGRTRAEDSKELSTGQHDFLLAFRGNICQRLPWGADYALCFLSPVLPMKYLAN